MAVMPIRIANRMKKLLWGVFLVLTFIITLPATWTLLSKADFFYPTLYDTIHIDAHISRYAPKNINGYLGFEDTSKAERVALFHGIVKAINNHGVGLKKLFYTDKNNQLLPLLTLPEVIHLQDVANLLDKLKFFVVIFFLFWFFLVVFIKYKKVVFPSGKSLFASTIIIILLVSMLLFLGPERIFNQLHIWVFPDNHQWFFYYEESLMSTMMKAPDLFAYIAGIWGLLSIMLTVALIKLLKVFLSIREN